MSYLPGLSNHPSYTQKTWTGLAVDNFIYKALETILDALVGKVKHVMWQVNIRPTQRWKIKQNKTIKQAW